MISVPRAGETIPAAKVVYVTGYAPWQWALSCGAYVDDVDAHIEKIVEAGTQIDLMKTVGVA